MKEEHSKSSSKTRADKLAAVRDRISKTDFGNSRGFWAPKEGRNVIRILPEVKEMDVFFQPVGRHYMPPDRKKSVYCPSFTTDGELDCPICDYVEELEKAGDKASKKLADTIRRKKQFWMNIIDRSNEEAGPLIYTPGVSVFTEIAGMIGDPDYGDIYDVETGIDIIITKQGSGLDTEYSVKPRRENTPLSEDPDQVEEWLEKAKDLSCVELSNDSSEDAELSKGHAVFVLPKKRLSKEFFDTVEGEESSDDDDEDEKPVKKSSKKPSKEVEEDDDEDKPVKKSSKSSKPSKETEDDDDDEDDSSDDGDEVDKEIHNRKVNRRPFRH